MTIWHRMGDTLDWQALPVLVELHGVPDTAVLIEQLLVIRDHLQARRHAQQS